MELLRKHLKDNKTIIIDNFIDTDSFLKTKKDVLKKLNSKNAPDNMWYPLDGYHDHHNLCIQLIECAKKYYDLTKCSGYEFWTQNNTVPQGWHYDIDEQCKVHTGKIKYPLCSIVYYVNIQNLEGGKLHLEDTIITPKENRIVIFPPITEHFVENFSGERTSFLVNPWSTPLYKDTDGL